MNEQVIEEWVRELRRPDMQAKQGTNHLGTTGGKRCCLGVLCDLAVKAGVIPPPEANVITSVLSYNGMDSVLPQSVRDWVGLRHANGTDLSGVCLAEENDNGATFQQIADLIEKHKKGLFVAADSDRLEDQ